MNLVFWLSCTSKEVHISWEKSGSHGEDTGTVVAQESISDSGFEEDSAEPSSEEEPESLENTSQAPPQASCMENEVQIQTGEKMFFLRGFWWELGEDENGPNIFIAGYNSGGVDVCSGLGDSEGLMFSQVNFSIVPNLAALPQQVGLGIPGYSENVAAKMTFVEDPLADDRRFFWVMEGEATLNSFLISEKGLLSQVHVGQMGYDISGELSDFVTSNVIFSGGHEIVACYCEGLRDFYASLPNEVVQ